MTIQSNLIPLGRRNELRTWRFAATRTYREADHSAARRAATIWSAVRPVSSAMWSNLAVKVPTPAVAERSSTIRSPISDLRHLRAHHVPAGPALARVEAEDLAAPPGHHAR